MIENGEIGEVIPLLEELSVYQVGRLHHYQVGYLGQEGYHHHLQLQRQELVVPHDHWDF